MINNVICNILFIMAFDTQFDNRITINGVGIEDAYGELYDEDHKSKFCTVDSAQTITGAKTFSETCTFSKDINGTALRAKWADLAECYQLDGNYPAGTLLQFGGTKEMTIATTKVNAIVSSAPGFVLNEGNGIPICLSGRVPVRIIGPVSKFDHIKLHNNGVGIVDNETNDYFAVALESNTNQQEKLVLCCCQLTI